MYFILALRFLLEITAILGFLLALIIKLSWLEKGLFLLLDAAFVFSGVTIWLLKRLILCWVGNVL